MTSATDLLDEESVIAWAYAHGVIPSIRGVRAKGLSGGISNVVLAVHSGDRSAVVKQSLPELRVAEKWEFDRARVVTERKAISYLSTIIPGHVPEVLAVDDEHFAFAMTMAPPPGEVWKTLLMRGELDPGTAGAAGAILGHIQTASRSDRELLADFDDRMPLVQGRIQPYHLTAAAKNPDVADIITRHADQLVAARDVLTLGDFAPKNLLAYPDRVFIIDLEVAHLGHAAFDPAFLLTHLVLKSLVLPSRVDDLATLAATFWSAYQNTAGEPAAESDVRVALGCLLLARADGKSQVEYLGAHAPSVRAAAKDLLTSDVDTPIHESVARALHTLGGTQ